MIKTSKLFTAWIVLWLLLVCGQLFAKLPSSPQHSALSQHSATSTAPFHLTVLAEPANARVRIMNIRDKYRPAMVLAPGRYRVQVDAPGYRSQQFWLTVKAGRPSQPLHVALQRQ
ncbi:carboxypeptidase-like regulatory domain-containing protein [Gallaecimonas mangrovi]|uniref:carboxypeptidase-like regulatory domain-containing protein n=1 Tax=Gallaecimonas mangrovi TaxID=2291597 RepID=UPI000E20A350|nr:carboxypeptidase-like regulatory domain-containing protein [Gallaecimonas mangrovi]